MTFKCLLKMMLRSDLIISPGDEIMIRCSSDSIVPKSLQEPLLGTQPFSVDLSFYMIGPDTENITFVAKITSGISNSGMYQVMIEEINMIQDYAGGVIGISILEQFVGRSKRGITDVFKKVVGKVIKWGTILVLSTSVKRIIGTRALCEAWVWLQPDDIGDQILIESLPVLQLDNRQLRMIILMKKNIHLYFTLVQIHASNKEILLRKERL